jgi:hypothetical protein
MSPRLYVVAMAGVLRGSGSFVAKIEKVSTKQVVSWVVLVVAFEVGGLLATGLWEENRALPSYTPPDFRTSS